MSRETPARELWSPGGQLRSGAAISRYMDGLGSSRGLAFQSYQELWRWSVGELEDFWASIWEDLGVLASSPYERVLSSREMPGARWFEGARLNYAENILARGHHDGALALQHRSETRPGGEMTWGELRAQVAALAAGMRSLGVGPGDRVSCYMPNIPETLVAFLATAAIGAVWSSAAPEFGAGAVVDRFAQIEPKLLFAVDGYRNGGRSFDRREVLERIVSGLSSLEQIVHVPYLHMDTGIPGPTAAGPSRRSWGQLLELGSGAAPRFEQVPADHPLWILYSSGTTGLPKAIVHGHGGILLEHLKKANLHLDLREGDRMFWYTTTGWMMWNLLVGCLLSPASIILYDGSPGQPDSGVLWRLAEETGMTGLGTSAGFLSAARRADLRPGAEHDLSALRSIGSTGSPLSPETFAWVYEAVDPDIWLYSTSGGTDVCTAFVGGCPILPVRAGELQCRALGCAVEAFDEAGRSLTGQVGELVITEPMPSMPVCLWGDRDGELLRESYFSMYPGVWRHGDWIRINEDGSAVIEGRSDSTINRQGVRIGTAEIYRAVAAVEEVADALVVDVPRPGGAGELTMLLFVVLADGAGLDEALERRIRQAIREGCSPRHVPDRVLEIAEVPRTLSGKVLEVPVKRILSGFPAREVASRDSLANPAALDQFVALARELS